MKIVHKPQSYPLLFPELETDSGAIFCQCGKYRYALWRKWDKSLPTIMFVGLNPSTADETHNDPTIRRVIQFAKYWGYGSIWMTNLFALVTTDPKNLLTERNPIGQNDKWLLDISKKCEDKLYAWGSFKEAKQRANKVLKMLGNGMALKINNDGSPMHPLYVKATTKPLNYPV